MPTYTQYTGDRMGGGGFPWSKVNVYQQNPLRGGAHVDDFFIDQTASYNIQGTADLTDPGAAANAAGGVIRFTTGATDGNEAGLALHSGGLLQVGLEQNFLIRFRLEQLTLTSFVMGLVDEAASDGALMGTTYTTASLVEAANPSFVGFHLATTTDADGVWASYRAAGDTGLTTVSAAANLTIAAALNWVVLCVRIRDDGVCEWYINGVQADDGSISIADTGITSGTHMVPVAMISNGSTAARFFEVDTFAYTMEKEAGQVDV